jgi:bifunctional pyridoxal-dependent enzyme with beta-cystathionase and maltose regulon repressor activities
VHILRHQAEVIVTPGTEFGPQSGDSIRLNFSQPHQAAVAALDRIVELLGQYRA